MPSERLSPRKRTRLAMGACLVLLSSLACASNAQPQALSATRDTLAELDEANQWQHVQVPAPAPTTR